MKTYLILLVLAAVCAFSTQLTGAAENSGRVHSITLPKESAELKPGPGLDTVEKYCTICHSSDYIIMQPPFPEKNGAK